MLEFIRALETRSGFHSKGPVRMLMWMTDREKTNLLPRTINSRRRLAVRNELSCDVEEIVGDALGPSAIRREAHIDLQSSVLTAERMRMNGIVVPISRMDELPRRLRSEGTDAVIQSSRDSDSGIHGERTWHKELHELQKGFADGSYSKFIDGPPGYDAKKPKGSKMKRSAEYRRLQQLLVTEREQRRKKAFVDDILTTDAQIRALQLAIVSNEHLDDKTHTKKTRELNKLTDEYRERLAQQTDRRRNSIHFFADDRIAWAGDCSLLLWDHRTAEPIVARANEFHSNRTLALMDFQSKTSSSQILTATQQQYLESILTSLFTTPTLPITVALDSIAPGAAAAIIPNAPSLRDPRRGGRMDLDHLRVRVLTLEMLREIAVAWDGWLFKPAMAAKPRTLVSVDHDVTE